MSFDLDLKKFVEKAGARADEAVGQIVLGIHTRLDARSPVGDAKYWQSPPPKGYVGGRFRANWQLGIGGIPGGQIATPDPSGSTVRARIAQAIPEEAAGNVYYITNNVPYALRIENGWSRQAPNGVVGLTMVEVQSIVDEAVSVAKAKLP